MVVAAVGMAAVMEVVVMEEAVACLRVVAAVVLEVDFSVTGGQGAGTHFREDLAVSALTTASRAVRTMTGIQRKGEIGAFNRAF